MSFVVVAFHPRFFYSKYMLCDEQYTCIIVYESYFCERCGPTEPIGCFRLLNHTHKTLCLKQASFDGNFLRAGLDRVKKGSTRCLFFGCLSTEIIQRSRVVSESIVHYSLYYVDQKL